ncbi:MAG: type II toxin-antitoxin system VapC family toxin [Bacteroidota bacterium]
MNLFLDTSGLIKLYHKERGSQALFQFLQENRSEMLIAVSAIGTVEFHSTIFKLVRVKELEPAEASRARGLFNADLGKCSRIQIDERVLSQAVELLEGYGSTISLRTLDALQISSAIVFQKQSPIDFFISSDTNQLTVARHFFPTLNPLKM